MRVRVKVCGLTRPEDARAAAALGVDAIGVIFYPPSPRGVDIEQARAVVDAAPAFVTTVGVFVDPRAGEVEAVLARVPLDLVQFHGREDPDLCAAVGRPYIKVVGMRAGVDLEAEAARHPLARAILIDTFSEALKGGTGCAFDWSLIPSRVSQPLILAGGLNAANVAQGIRAVGPFGVDVSGGVESGPGIKDVAKIESFMREVSSVQAA